MYVLLKDSSHFARLSIVSRKLSAPAIYTTLVKPRGKNRSYVTAGAHEPLILVSVTPYTYWITVHDLLQNKVHQHNCLIQTPSSCLPQKL